MLDSGILIRSYQAKVKDMGKEKRGGRTASGAANVEAFELYTRRGNSAAGKRRTM